MSITARIAIALVGAAAICLVSSMAFASSQPYISGHEINFGVGNKYHAATDVTITGPTHSLSFRRTYNSQSTETGTMGYGWTSSFGERLIIDPADTSHIVLVQSGGRQVHFFDNSAGAWVNESGKVRAITSSGVNYQLTEPNGTVFTFDASGHLSEKRTRNGYTLTFSYDPVTSLLSSVTDSFGKTLSFEHLNNRLKKLITPIGDFIYEYDAFDNLEYVHKPGIPTSIIQYIYDDLNDELIRVRVKLNVD